MMSSARAIWVVGRSLSGKTTRLVKAFQQWVGQQAEITEQSTQERPGVLAFAALGEHRLELADRLSAATQVKYPFTSTTPTGFWQDEVQLFWPLLIQQLELKAQFPIRLTPESEQELATQLWRVELDRAIAAATPLSEARLVRRILDLLQLAALAGRTIADIPQILEQGLGGSSPDLPFPFEVIGEMLQRWQNWCLGRGLLTYSLTASLYWQYLLPHPLYQQQLTRRYSFILADDVDEYPAIARILFETLLAGEATMIFTFNPEGAIRLGLGADPDDLATLARLCQVETLPQTGEPTLAGIPSAKVIQLALEPILAESLPDSFQLIQTTARSQLLRKIANQIITAVQDEAIQPREIAVIGPGLDAIARYALIEMLTQHQIPVESLNDQRPLSSFPIVRALLTLLALVYPGLGRLLERSAIAEMLVVLTHEPPVKAGLVSSASTLETGAARGMAIDPVRAGLLADYCFAPHPERPRLLPVHTFPRWDRLGYRASEAYTNLVEWITQQQTQLEQRLIPNAIALMDRAIQHFLQGGGGLRFDQLSALRQLLETSQHYWEVTDRLRRIDGHEPSTSLVLSRFIQLLRSGTITANPFPVRSTGANSNAITLATVFQYRASRRRHRWQFWLDAGSSRWLSGVDALFAAPLFLQAWAGTPWTTADALVANEQRLRRILLDLLARCEERVYLCHSDLATNGQEQVGGLIALVNAAIPEPSGSAGTATLSIL